MSPRVIGPIREEAENFQPNDYQLLASEVPEVSGFVCTSALSPQIAGGPAALLENLAPEPHTRLRYFCSLQHTDSAFSPIIGQMERAAGLLHDDTPEQKLDKLDALLAQTSTSIQDAALISEMLSLQNDGRYPALELTRQQRRQKTLEAITTQMETLSRQQPVLMIFEDAHWADPSSLEAW